MVRVAVMMPKTSPHATKQKVNEIILRHAEPGQEVRGPHLGEP